MPDTTSLSADEARTDINLSELQRTLDVQGVELVEKSSEGNSSDVASRVLSTFWNSERI